MDLGPLSTFPLPGPDATLCRYRALERHYRRKGVWLPGSSCHKTPDGQAAPPASDSNRGRWPAALSLLEQGATPHTPFGQFCIRVNNSPWHPKGQMSSNFSNKEPLNGRNFSAIRWFTTMLSPVRSGPQLWGKEALFPRQGEGVHLSPRGSSCFFLLLFQHSLELYLFCYWLIPHYSITLL